LLYDKFLVVKLKIKQKKKIKTPTLRSKLLINVY
jgi:hypothetical protein